jgi:hypothetical protein
VSRIYTREETNTIEQSGNAVIDSILEKFYIIRIATRNEQLNWGIDRILTDSMGQLFAEYKIDVRAASTGNLALEERSVYDTGYEIAGWAKNPKRAQVIYDYVPGLSQIYVIDVEYLRKLRPLIVQTFSEKPPAMNVGHLTYSRCPPIKWLDDNGLFLNILPVFD